MRTSTLAFADQPLIASFVSARSDDALAYRNATNAELPNDSRLSSVSNTYTQCNLTFTTRLNAGDIITVQPFSDPSCPIVGRVGYALLVRTS
ncbi:hypothetical protein [Methylobacterium hispanicum]|uniref:hypothetical protein n=1 Tax=Methylobacterium hispanicum TaxID=270350 RepID=UPI002F35D64D